MYLGLRTRYSLVLVIIALAIVGTVTATLLFEFKDVSRELHGSSSATMSTALYKQLLARGRGHVQLIAESLVEPVSREDFEDIANIVFGALGVADVTSVFVYDRQGRVVHDGTVEILAYDQLAPEPVFEAAILDGEWLIEAKGAELVITGPIAVGSYVLGAVSLTLDQSFAENDIQDLSDQLDAVVAESSSRFVGSATILAIVLSMLSMGVGIAVSDRLAKPITSLARLAGQVGQGNYDIRVPWHRRDELGDLAQSFEDMGVALRETTVSKQFLNDIITSMFDGLMVLAPDGTIRAVNDATCRLTGFAADELLGRQVSLLLRDQVDSQLGGATTVLPGRLDSIKCIYTKTNHQVPVLFASSPMADRDGLIVCVFQDISKLKRAEQDKARLERQLLQAHKMEALGVLAGGIAHEFNNLLVPMIGLTEVAIDDLPRDSPAGASLGKVLTAGNRARGLVDRILAFSRQDEVEREAVDLGGVIDEALSLLRSVIPATIEIRTHIDRAGGLVFADPGQIHQVLINLASNAAGAIDEEYGVLEVHLDTVALSPEEASMHSSLTPGPHHRLRVSDTGCGMGHDVVERIFDPFFTTKEVGEGSGMGLAVVHGIVTAHGGAISVESKVGQGTMFEILLPVWQPAASLPSMGQTPRRDVTRAAGGVVAAGGYGTLDYEA
ncbi:MAG: ATP-binding protein [Alphaproteobacteria bacterium]